MSNYYDKVEEKTRKLKAKAKKVRDTAATEDIQLPMKDRMRVHSKLDKKTKKQYTKHMMGRITTIEQANAGASVKPNRKSRT